MTAPADVAGQRPLRVFGFWTCLALVVGNMIGSGFYLLPASLAKFGWNGVFGWLVTILGALCLAGVFGALARSFPRAGGPYAYSKEAFGPLVGFLVAWSYWLSMPIGNAAIATGVIAPLGTLVPAIARHSILTTCALVWLLTAINCFDARLFGRIQVIATAIKFLPLAAVVLLAALILGRSGGSALPPLDPATLHIGGPTGINAAAAIVLWAFLGLESATVPAERVSGEGRTIFRATLIGTALTGCVYLFAGSSVALLVPQEQLAASGAPMADFVRPHWGELAAILIALGAAVSAFGTLNGWILLQGELPWAMAKDGVLPAWLARLSPRGTPVRAHLVASALLTLMLVINQTRGLGDLFTFLILLATLSVLLPYLACALAALKLQSARRMPTSRWLPPVALIGALFSLWAIWGAGVEAILWGLVLLLVGVPIYVFTKQRSDKG